MYQKICRMIKRFIKFVLLGYIRRDQSIESITTPEHVNYHMTSVFPDKETKDEVLRTIRMQ